MSPQQEHDYIGLADLSPTRDSSEHCNAAASAAPLNLKETELRLGLPGFEFPDRKPDDKAPLKSLVSGSKRGFSDAIDASVRWGVSASSASDVELAKAGGLFSTRTGKAGLDRTPAMQPSPSPAVDASGASPAPEKKAPAHAPADRGAAPASKAQVVGWPPIRSFRKNSMATSPAKSSEGADSKLGSGCLYVKVSMDGAPYLRKVDLKTYSNYVELSSALEKMFSCFTIGQCGSHGVPGREGLTESRLMDLLHGSEYVLTYEDKDGDWMLVGDVPWEMFRDSCRRLRIMKGSEAIGLAPRAMEKCKNRN